MSTSQFGKLRHYLKFPKRYPPSDPARANELHNGLTWALNSLMVKIEQGMTVEIRALPRPAEPGAEPELETAFAEINETAKRLEFPKLSGMRVLSLT